MSLQLERLEQFLAKHRNSFVVEQLTADASTREYFRVKWQDTNAIACVYPDGAAEVATYLDVTQLFLAAGLPVAMIYDHDARFGIVVQEDLGDRLLRDQLVGESDARREELILGAVSLIPRIQAATPVALSRNSIASKLKFDVDKLLWELDFFRVHYFKTLRKSPLTRQVDQRLGDEFLKICKTLESQANVLCHRDFHAANLMIDDSGGLRIIDHQDARIGSAAYDLVSLLLDRVTEAPSEEWLASKRRVFLEERQNLGLPNLDEDAFAEEFRLQTIQRCLKAIGTFSFQSARRKKTHFLQFIKPAFAITLRAAEYLYDFPVLQRIIREELKLSGP